MNRIRAQLARYSANPQAGQPVYLYWTSHSPLLGNPFVPTGQVVPPYWAERLLLLGRTLAPTGENASSLFPLFNLENAVDVRWIRGGSAVDKRGICETRKD